MSRVPTQVRPDEAHAKATAWADRLKPAPADRARCVEQWTQLFLEMDRDDFEAH